LRVISLTYFTLFAVTFASLSVNLEDVLLVKASQDPWDLYEDPLHGISFQYHKKWKIVQEPVHEFNIVNLNPPHSSRNVDYLTTVAINIDQPAPSNQTLTPEEYAQKAVDSLNKSYTYFHLIENITTTTLSGKPAYKFIYADLVSVDDPPLKTMEVGTVVNNRAVYIEYLSQDPDFSKHMPTVEKILKSFQISLPSKTTSGDSMLNNKENQEFRKFNDRTTGVSLWYPSGWLQQYGDHMAIVDYVPVYGSTYNSSFNFLSPLEGRLDEVQESFELQVENLPSTNVTIEDYAKASLDIIRESIAEENASNFSVIEYNSTTLSGIKAYKILFTFTLEGTNYMVLHRFAINDNLVYYTSFFSEASKYSSFTTILDRIFNTFNIEGQSLLEGNRA
jgi:hypothetical protein